MHTLESLRTEIELRDAQISNLENKLITLEHLGKHAQDTKTELERLKLVESQL